MHTCETCTQAFEITAKELSLYERISPRYGNNILHIPPPKHCPGCREQQRMSWRNERNIFIRQCSKSGKKLFSAYTPETEFPVIDNALWWQPENDAKDFAQPIDFSRSISEQMSDLRRVVPRMSNFNYADDRLVNSSYANCAGDLKDCYLVFAAARDEHCMYCTYINDCFSCVDCFFTHGSTNCYEGVDLQRCHSVFYSADSRECSESYFLYDCRNCTHCIGCVGLRNKQYHIFNRPFSREEFERESARLGVARGKTLTHEAVQQLATRFEKLLGSLPRRATHGESNENCTGDYVSNSKDCFHCFDTVKSRDCMHCAWFDSGKDSADVYAWGEMELCYNICGGGQDMYGCAFTAMSFACKESFYLDLCVYCKNCIACIGLKNQQYCILNKQYSKAEYEALLPRVVELMISHGEWGEFLPSRDSTYGYNYSIAADYYPLGPTSPGAEKFHWDPYRAPESTAASSDSTLRCAETNRLFRLTTQEQDFYQTNDLPSPRFHPDVRHKQRLNSRNPRRLWNRFCEKCGDGILTSYSPENPLLVYCERCYLEAVY